MSEPEVGRPREQLVAVDQIEQRHRLFSERVYDVPIVDYMAATYDPAELDRLGLLSLKPDREAARRWYERARQLGGADAEQQLRRLGPN